MKTKLLIIGFILLGFGIQAQNIKVPTSGDLKRAEQNVKSEAEKATSQVNIGSIIGQLTNNISSEAFIDSFNKNKGSFISKVNDIKDPSGASSALQTLQGGLLPSVMDAGWGSVKDKWVKDAKTANTVKTVAGLASILESNISDKYFKGDWVKARPAWQAALGALSK